MSYDMFGQREMSRAIIELKPVGNFFRTTFFSGPPEEHNTDTIDIDVYKGNRRVAPYTRASAKSTPLARTPFQTGVLKLPYIKLSRSMEAAMAFLRQPGETIYGGKTPAQRAQEQIVKDLAELEEAIQRAEELQCAQAIIDANIIIKGFDTDAEIDLQRDADLEFTVDAADFWNTETADIHAQLRSYARLVHAKSGYTPNVLLAGANVLDALFSNEQAMKLLDNRRTNVGELRSQPTTTPGINARSYGDFAGFTLWEYYESYDLDNEDGTVTNIPLIPDDYIILASTGMKCVPHYGAIKDFGAMVPLKRFVKTIEEQDPSTKTAIVQTSPAMINHTPDATAKIKVL